MIVYMLPLNEVVFDFYDRLKSITKGFASFDYSIDEYKKGDLVKVSILVNSESELGVTSRGAGGFGSTGMLTICKFLYDLSLVISIILHLLLISNSFKLFNKFKVPIAFDSNVSVGKI